MIDHRLNIKVLVEGQPEKFFLEERIIKKYSNFFLNVEIEIRDLGIKSILLSPEQLKRHAIMVMNDPNFICIFLPDFHPNNCRGLDHSNLNSLRDDIYSEVERLHPNIRNSNYKDRFLIHTLKQGGDVIFLPNINLVFDELGITDETFKREIIDRFDLDKLEESIQDPNEISYEKLIMEDISNKVGKEYSIKNYEKIIIKLNFSRLINYLSYFKALMIDLLNFTDQSSQLVGFRNKFGL